MEKILRIIVLLLMSILMVTFILVLLGVIPIPTIGTISSPAQEASTLVTTLTPVLTPMPIPTATVEPIRIGVAIALSGENYQTGKEQEEGAEIAKQYFNSRGGVNGRDIQLDIQNAEDSVDGARKKFNYLISKDEIVAIIGPTYSTQAFEVNPISQEASIPVIAPSNTAQGIPQIGDHIFRVSASVSEQAKYAVTAASGQGDNIEKVATIYDADDEFSKSEHEAFMDAIDEFGYTLVISRTFKTGDKNFLSQINEILDSQPDLVIVSGLTSEGGRVVEQLREAGYEGVLIGGDSLNTPKIINICKEKCDGMIMPQIYNYESETLENQKFVEAYQARNDGKNPPQYAALMFTAVQVIVEALREEDRISSIQGVELPKLREKLKERLQSEMKFQTPLGEIYFDSEGEVNPGALRASQIIDGEIQIIK